MGHNWYTSKPHTGSTIRAGRAGRAYRPTKDPAKGVQANHPNRPPANPQELRSRNKRSNRPAPRDSLRAGTPAGGGAGATALKLSVGADQPNHLKAFI